MSVQRWDEGMHRRTPRFETSAFLPISCQGETASNVVPLWDRPVDAVTGLLEAASAPARSEELVGEDAARAVFRSIMAEQGQAPRRHLRLVPIGVAAGSLAGLVVGATTLVAASVLPPSAAPVHHSTHHASTSLSTPATTDTTPGTSQTVSPATPGNSSNSGANTTQSTTGPQTGSTSVVSPPATVTTNPSVVAVTIPKTHHSKSSDSSGSGTGTQSSGGGGSQCTSGTTPTTQPPQFLVPTPHVSKATATGSGTTKCTSTGTSRGGDRGGSKGSGTSSGGTGTAGGTSRGGDVGSGHHKGTHKQGGSGTTTTTLETIPPATGTAVPAQ